MNDLLAILAGLAVGAGSALVPVLNAEAYAVVGGAASGPAVALGLVAALAVGQTGGKLALFEVGRRGGDWLPRRWAERLKRRHASTRTSRWTERVQGWLRAPVSGAVTVLTSAAAGLPPLAVVSVAAGAAGQRRTTFAVCCLLGRTLRFAALVLPAAMLS